MAMKNEIWVWHYELKSAGGLNSVSPRTSHRGTLIRVGAGFGCIHPWPELGDADLEEQLKSLVDQNPTQPAAIALECTYQDGMARCEGRSLFAGVNAPIPESHWLFQTGDDIQTIRGEGFGTVKVKIGPENPATELIEALADEGLRIRLDANASFPFAQFRDWWDFLPARVVELIEFVEDPVPWNWWHWHCLEQAGVPLAVDRDAEKKRPHCPWAIFKPAVNREENLLPWVREKGMLLAVTSYLDHPLGQIWAALAAQRLNVDEPEWLGECGLLSHRCFEKNAFSEQLRVIGSVLQVPEGTGLGFDDLLEALPWKRLT
jgi:o-succinylbenzoate synthase